MEPAGDKPSDSAKRPPLGPPSPIPASRKDTSRDSQPVGDSTACASGQETVRVAVGAVGVRWEGGNEKEGVKEGGKWGGNWEEEEDEEEGEEEGSDGREKGGRGSSQRVKLPRPEGGVSCPRCGSDDTKFCYYNNYNIKQPRYFCKTCQRYWTVGGTLRNVPIGSGRRKSKTASGKDHEKAGFVTLETQQGLGVYGTFRNVLDPLFAYGGMVNAGKAHTLGTAFTFPCASLDSMNSNLGQQEAQDDDTPSGGTSKDEEDSQGTSGDPGRTLDLEKAVMCEPCIGRSDLSKAVFISEDGSVDGRRVKLKTSSKSTRKAVVGGANFQQYRPSQTASAGKSCPSTAAAAQECLQLTNAWINVPWAVAQQASQQVALDTSDGQPQPCAMSMAVSARNAEEKDPNLMASASGAEADWYSIAALAAMNQQVAAVMAAATVNGVLGGTQGGIGAQNSAGYSSLPQQAQTPHTSQVHAQAAHAQLQAQIQAQAQTQVHSAHAQAQLQVQAQSQVQEQAAQAVLRLQAAQAMSQVALAGWGQGHMPYWPGMWNPYGHWPSSSVRGHWGGAEQPGTPSDSGGCDSAGEDLHDNQGHIPVSCIQPPLPREQSPTCAGASHAQAVGQDTLSSGATNFLYGNNAPGQVVSPKAEVVASGSAGQNPGIVQAVMVPGTGLMGINPWMHLPGFAMGWGAGACNANVPAPFGGWMGAMAMGSFSPNVNSNMSSFQPPGYPSQTQAGGICLAGNSDVGIQPGNNSGAGFSTRKPSRYQDSSVF